MTPKDTVEEQADKLATSITNLAFEKGAKLRTSDFLNVKKEIQKALTTAYNKGVEDEREKVMHMVRWYSKDTWSDVWDCLLAGFEPHEWDELSSEEKKKALTPLPDDKI
jgi:hypothetical protein